MAAIKPEHILKLLNRDSLSQPKVLLVEDNEIDAILIRNILETYYPMTLIDQATTKAQALQFLKCNHYDVILLDLNLPDAIGAKDIQQYQTHSNNAPLIVITDSSDMEVIKAARKYGADGIISKNHLSHIKFDDAIEEAVNNIGTA